MMTFVLMLLCAAIVLLNVRLFAVRRQLGRALIGRGRRMLSSYNSDGPVYQPPDRDWREEVVDYSAGYPTVWQPNKPDRQCSARTSTPLGPGLPADIVARAANNAWRCSLEEGHSVGHRFMGQGGGVMLGCGTWSKVPRGLPGAGQWGWASCNAGHGHSGPHLYECFALHPTKVRKPLKAGDEPLAEYCRAPRGHEGPHIHRRYIWPESQA